MRRQSDSSSLLLTLRFSLFNKFIFIEKKKEEKEIEISGVRERFSRLSL